MPFITDKIIIMKLCNMTDITSTINPYLIDNIFDWLMSWYKKPQVLMYIF